MLRVSLSKRTSNAGLALVWLALVLPAGVMAQQATQNEAEPPAAASGKGPLGLPAPAEPAKPKAPAARAFTPTEKVRADADVAFPADI